MCEGLSYQIIKTLAVNQAVLLLEVRKNHYKKENISVSRSIQIRYSLF